LAWRQRRGARSGPEPYGSLVLRLQSCRCWGSAAGSTRAVAGLVSCTACGRRRQGWRCWRYWGRRWRRAEVTAALTCQPPPGVWKPTTITVRKTPKDDRMACTTHYHGMMIVAFHARGGFAVAHNRWRRWGRGRIRAGRRRRGRGRRRRGRRLGARQRRRRWRRNRRAELAAGITCQPPVFHVRKIRTLVRDERPEPAQLLAGCGVRVAGRVSRPFAVRAHPGRL